MTEIPTCPVIGELGRESFRIAGMAPSLKASAVIDAGEAEGYGEWAAWMRERYRLGETQ